MKENSTRITNFVSYIHNIFRKIIGSCLSTRGRAEVGPPASRSAGSRARALYSAESVPPGCDSANIVKLRISTFCRTSHHRQYITAQLRPETSALIFFSLDSKLSSIFFSSSIFVSPITAFQLKYLPFLVQKYAEEHHLHGVYACLIRCRACKRTYPKHHPIEQILLVFPQCTTEQTPFPYPILHYLAVSRYASTHGDSSKLTLQSLTIPLRIPLSTTILIPFVM